MLAALLVNLHQYGGGADPTPYQYASLPLPDKKRFDKQIKQWLDEVVLEQDETPIAAEAKKIIAPYRETVDFSIDWEKLKKDLETIEKIFYLYQLIEINRLKRLKDDEEFLLLLYAAFA